MKWPFGKVAAGAPPDGGMPLVRWIWRSYFRTSLLPLLIVEVALIALYFISNSISNRANIEAVRRQAEENVVQVASREAAGINRQLEAVARATGYLKNRTAEVMQDGSPTVRDDPSRFATSKDGVFYTARDNGGSALFYSGIVPVGKAERDKAMRSAGLDPAFKGVKQNFPLIVQVYYNTFDSMNRIYPYFDVLPQYAPKMDIPSFNFYYEADLKHNPRRSVVWTDVYVDPAGQGWMTSCIAPVYNGDFLDGVVGTDVTVGTIIKEVLNLNVPWHGYGLLVGRTGTIIALPQAGESDWGLKELTRHHYAEAIQKDTFKPDDFNVFNRGPDRRLSGAIRTQSDGMFHADLGSPHLVAWATIPETGWKLLISVPEENIYAPAQSLADRLNTIAWMMVLGMLGFYLIFFTVLYRRARQMSESVSMPLERIDEMVRSVAAGQYRQEAQDFPVAELRRTAQGIVQMGEQLDHARSSRMLAEEALVELTRHLQSVFDLSPDGFVSIDDTGRVALVNPAFCRITGQEAGGWLWLKEEAMWRKFLQMTANPAQMPDLQTSFRIELIRPRKRVLHCTVRSMERQDGSLASRVVYLRDITQEDELNLMKSQFLATAAHELRTPLTSVLGYAELLYNGHVPEESRSDALATIYKQSQWLVKIINELLDLTRIESRAGVDFVIQTCDAAILASDIVQDFSVPKGRQPVVLESLQHQQVDVDIQKFKVVMHNVLDNAYKFSSSGDVRLTMLVERSATEPRIGYRITDSGIGIAEDQVGKVCERFWRADGSGSTPGTGLGMSIATEIMRVLRGSIEISSLPGHGTAVTLWLPDTSPGATQ